MLLTPPSSQFHPTLHFLKLPSRSASYANVEPGVGERMNRVSACHCVGIMTTIWHEKERRRRQFKLSNFKGKVAIRWNRHMGELHGRGDIGATGVFSLLSQTTRDPGRCVFQVSSSTYLLLSSSSVCNLHHAIPSHL
jgi:hypothetical protein